MAALHHLRGVALTTPWVVWLFFIDLSVSALLPLRPLFPKVTYNLSSSLAVTVWRWIQYIFEYHNGARITISGDKLPSGESAIVVCNHVAWCDFYMIQAVAERAGMLSRCRYFAKKQLRWVPFLGWGIWGLGMPMVTRSWDRDRAELDRAFGGITKQLWPTWLISFSEATRFTAKKFIASQEWATANDRPQPKNLLYPRTKGFITTVRHLRQAPHMRAVYDLTIAYQHGDKWQVAPAMWETMSVPNLSLGKQGYRFHVHVRRFPLEELPETDSELAKWLEKRWVEKGEWLEELRKSWSTESKAQ